MCKTDQYNTVSISIPPYIHSVRQVEPAQAATVHVPNCSLESSQRPPAMYLFEYLTRVQQITPNPPSNPTRRIPTP